MKLQFWGAAENVTGSSYLFDSGQSKVLVDCGMYQERTLQERNWGGFPIPPSELDAVLLTHAHLDHCGLLPKLVREGFRGRIYCTQATAELAEVILYDSARIQAEDVAFKKKRHEREKRVSPHPLEPLYTVEDVEDACRRFRGVPYGAPVEVAPGIQASFHEAGHIFGSAMIRLQAGTGADRRALVFSGDIGRCHLPIIRDPTFFDEADYVVMESTYGDREHDGRIADIPGSIADVVNRTHEAGGNIVIPSFAVERTQELLYYLNQLLHDDRIPHLLVFVDSPMASRVTQVFRRHQELFDEDMRARLKAGQHPCDFPGLVMTDTADQSKAINHIRSTAIVIAGSGMCTGGRIKHHLVNNIGRPECTVLFVGYQAAGTLGRQILDGNSPVRILGTPHEVKARIERIRGFSGHADRNELLKWVTSLKSPPRRVFITHGEPDAARAFQDLLAEKTGWPAQIPKYRETVILE